MSKNETPYRYIPGQGLAAAAKIAVEMEIPLLVTGEPGTGKTELASWIAHIQGTEMFRFNTKTTSQARDLFYRYDAIRHFRDSQRKKVNTLDYIQFDALGKAIINSVQKRYVVLVDEVDKAPRDFTNDLLFEFEKMAFQIDEATREDLADQQFWSNKHGMDAPAFDTDCNISLAKGKPKPILILTSNSEKNLPDAFLRRCAFYHIPFPDPETLLKIIKIHGFIDEKFPETLAIKAIEFFGRMRDQGLRKKPATAELLAWTHMLKKWDIDPTRAGEDKALEERIRQTLSLLAKNKEDLQRLTEDFKFS